MKQEVDAIICNTNMAVPITLSYLVGHPEKNIVLLSDMPNIIHFFEVISLSNCQIVSYSNYSSFFSLERKIELLQRMHKYKIENIYFFHFDYGGLANWYLKWISKSTNVFFCKLYNRKPYVKEPLRKYLKRQLIQYLHYGIWMDYHDGGIPSAPHSFYDSIGSKEITMPIDDKLIRKIIGNIGIEVHKNATLLLSGSLLSRNIVNEDDYEALLSNIVKILGETNVYVKCHPRFDDLLDLERKCTQIPNYIPGNLLVYFFDSFIGYDSLLLVEAARFGKKTISILDLIPCNDNDAKKRSRSYLEERLENKGYIYFPSSLEDLRCILADTK